MRLQTGRLHAKAHTKFSADFQLQIMCQSGTSSECVTFDSVEEPLSLTIQNDIMYYIDVMKISQYIRLSMKFAKKVVVAFEGFGLDLMFVLTKLRVRRCCNVLALMNSLNTAMKPQPRKYERK